MCRVLGRPTSLANAVLGEIPQQLDGEDVKILNRRCKYHNIETNSTIKFSEIHTIIALPIIHIEFLSFFLHRCTCSRLPRTL